MQTLKICLCFFSLFFYGAFVSFPSFAQAKASSRVTGVPVWDKLEALETEGPKSLSHIVVRGDTLYELAKEYGTTVELLRRLNGISGDRIYPGMKLKVTRVRFSLRVKRAQNRLILLADGRPLKRYPIATGEKDSTPLGTFKIVNKLEDPTWFKAGEVLPPDNPRNILGSRWLGFDAPGYGIHGTTLPETVGAQTSQGCVRMFDADVEEIYALVSIGTQVVVMD